MSETIINVLTELRRQWGTIYVTSQETTATIAEMQSKMDAMAAHAERMMTFATVCACVGFVLAVVAATILAWRWKYGDKGMEI